MWWYFHCKFKKVKEGNEGIFWFAICWNLWLLRNGVIFRNEECNVLDIVWKITFMIWKWSFTGDIT